MLTNCIGFEDVAKSKILVSSNADGVASAAVTRNPIKSKIADRLKSFEPPPPPSPPKEVSKGVESRTRNSFLDGVEQGSFSTRKSGQSSELPGSFPADDDVDETAVIADPTPNETSKKSKKSKLKAVANDPPPPVPDPPVSLCPPPEPRAFRKERAKIKDDGESWAQWNAAPSGDKKSSKSKSEKTSKRSAEKTSSKDSGSDKAESVEKADKTPARHRLSATFTTPPVSRSMSTRERRESGGVKGSRRYSVDGQGVASPPQDELPEMSSKAAKVLGVDKSSGRKKARKMPPPDDDDIVIVSAMDADLSAKREKRRSKRLYDEDIIMVEPGGPSETPAKRGLSTSKKPGIAGLFGGIMASKSARMDTRHDGEMGGHTDREGRASARKARRGEHESVEKESEELRRSKDEARRRSRRKREEEEARRAEAKEARRAEKRAARQREEEERHALEERQAPRAERRRLRKELEAAAIAAQKEEEARAAARQERRRSQALDPLGEEVERRRRREARRAARGGDTSGDMHRRSSRRHGEQSGDEQGHPQRERPRDSRKGATWPHSGTSSWVKDHSEAPPPP